MSSVVTRSIDRRASVEERAPRARVLDGLGVVLFLTAAAWMLWAAARSGGSAAPAIGLIVVGGLVLVTARMVASHVRVLVPMAALIAAIIVAARSRTGVVSTAPLSGPLEYINADGAFYVQAAIAGLMVASMGRSTLVRAVGFLGAGFFAALPFIVHAAAAAWLVLVLPSVALASVLLTGGRGPRASVALFALFFVASLTASILLGSTYSKTAHKSVFQRAAMKAVDEDRLLLWRDAFVIMRDHPETGVGPRRYQVVSPIGSKDPDYRWAHNEFLQQGAETGIAGLAILAAFFLWGFARLWAVRAPGAVTALGAASLAALGIHSCVDYVMHFPAIPLITAGLVGAAMIDGNERDLPKSAGAT